MSEYITLNYFLDSHQRVYWLYLLSGLFIVAIFSLFMPKVVKEQFSKEVLWHPSARLDYLYFLIMGFFKVLFVVPLIWGVTEVALWGVYALQDLFGYFERIRVSKEFLIIGYTISLFLVNDFTRYWVHRMLHLIPFLWRFHRIHHSAEVLNPLTFYRVHPIENIFFGFRYAISSGLVTAIFIYFFGAGIHMMEILGVNIFIFILSIIGTNLRHSHIPLSYGKSVEKWLISPYQHQLHHSTEYYHKNFGSYLAVWDRWFNTLENKKIKNLKFGLKDEKIEHSLLGLFINPFNKGVKL